MPYEIKRLCELDEGQVHQAITIFVDGFYNIFSLAVTKDKEILHALFLASFNRDMVYVLLDGGEVLGFMGLGNSERRAVRLDRDACIQLFGKWQGKMLYKQMGGMLEKINVQHGQEVYIDYVTTSQTYRGKGIASHLFKYVFETLPYTTYTLDVMSKNVNALRLYESLGFRKVKYMFNPITLICGLGRPILMRKEE